MEAIRRFVKAEDIIFLFLLAAVVFFHFDKLGLPHFWDEAWVYAPAIRSMAIGIPSLLPDALSVDLTRGHPLLFQFLGGVWMKVFGTSNTSAHVFALFISLCFLSVIYLLTRKYYGRGAAMAAALFVAAQPVFLSLSAMLYPEVLLSFGLVLALFGFAHGAVVLFATGLSVALLAKESAVVFFIAFFTWDVLRIIFLRDSPALLRKYTIPAIVMVMHPLLLYVYHGWFFYPEHTSFITTVQGEVMYRLRRVFEFVFHHQYREWLLYPLIVLGVLNLRLKRFWVKLLLIAIGFSAFKVLFIKWVVPGWLFPVIMVIACIAPLVTWYYARKEMGIKPIHHFFGAGYLVVIGFVLFSSMNFYTPRYMLNTIVLVCVMVAVLLWRSFLPRWSKVLLSIAGMAIPLYATMTIREFGELNTGLYDDLKVQRGMVNWMVENAGRGDTICTNFVTAAYLGNGNAGYVNHSNYFTAPFQDICSSQCNGKYLVYTATAAPCETYSHDLSHYTKVYSDTLNASFAVVFRRGQ